MEVFRYPPDREHTGLSRLTGEWAWAFLASSWHIHPMEVSFDPLNSHLSLPRQTKRTTEPHNGSDTAGRTRNHGLHRISHKVSVLHSLLADLCYWKQSKTVPLVS